MSIQRLTDALQCCRVPNTDHAIDGAASDLRAIRYKDQRADATRMPAEELIFGRWLDRQVPDMD